ncbi:MAG: hypothetical protein H0U71_06915 [Gammaproteobacteria bacterium]|nr:hypothetical protein [Gammaproteobacteria bacterium]
MKIVLFSVTSILFSNAVSANIHVRDYTSQFIKDYRALKTNSFESKKNFILKYELVTVPEICSIFFDGHPIPRDPRIETLFKSYVADLPELVAAYEKKVPEIRTIVSEVQERTQHLFGMKINADVVLSTSVSETDAVTTGDNISRPVVALNLREMVKYSNDDLKIVLAHELFHVLQHQIEVDHSNSDMIAGNLYSEGWATYASSLVYPGYSDWKYISYFTKDNSQFLKFQANKKAIIHDILKDWNSHNERKYNKYFSADGGASKPFEPRSGYYIGYLAAKTLAEKRPAVQVALIKYNDYKRQIKPLLKKMSEIS